jgi:hypothetical protein
MGFPVALDAEVLRYRDNDACPNCGAYDPEYFSCAGAPSCREALVYFPEVQAKHLHAQCITCRLEWLRVSRMVPILSPLPQCEGCGMPAAEDRRLERATLPAALNQGEPQTWICESCSLARANILLQQHADLLAPATKDPESEQPEIQQPEVEGRTRRRLSGPKPVVAGRTESSDPTIAPIEPYDPETDVLPEGSDEGDRLPFD